MNAAHTWSGITVDDDGSRRVCKECGLVERLKKAPGHSHGRPQWQREVDPMSKEAPGVLFIVEPPCDPKLKPKRPRYAR